MTNKNYYTGSNYDEINPMPTRPELHRYASNLLTEADFCTDYPSFEGFQTNRVVGAIEWTKKNAKNANWKFSKNF